MSSTIFDAIPKTGEEGFFQEAEEIKLPPNKSFIGKLKHYGKEYGKTALKGGAEGLYKLGRIMGPTGGAQNPEEFTEELDKILPNEENTFGQRAIRRGLKEAPSFLAFPGAASLSNLPRPIIAGFLGEGAKELGAPEWAQSALELTAYLGPDITKKLLSEGKNKDLLEAAKKLGLTDEQLTPLLQSEFKQKWLTKLTPRRGATQKALNSSKEGLGKSYEILKDTPSALKTIGETAERSLQNEIDHLLTQMPHDVRSKVLQDYKDLFAAPVTGKTLINFYQKVGHNIGDKSKQLSLLKKPISKMLYKIAAELGENFSTINKLYSKFSDISARLKPNLASDIVGAAETLGLVSSITMGNYPWLLKIGGEKAARKIAQQMLINPHFQQIGRKMVVALNHNKFGLAKNITEEYIKLIKKIDPNVAKKMEELKEEELTDFFTHQK